MPPKRTPASNSRAKPSRATGLRSGLRSRGAAEFSAGLPLVTRPPRQHVAIDHSSGNDKRSEVDDKMDLREPVSTVHVVAVSTTSTPVSGTGTPRLSTISSAITVTATPSSGTPTSTSTRLSRTTPLSSSTASFSSPLPLIELQPPKDLIASLSPAMESPPLHYTNAEHLAWARDQKKVTFPLFVIHFGFYDRAGAHRAFGNLLSCGHLKKKVIVAIRSGYEHFMNNNEDLFWHRRDLDKQVRDVRIKAGLEKNAKKWLGGTSQANVSQGSATKRKADDYGEDDGGDQYDEKDQHDQYDKKDQ
ncbi:hypothetical protein BGZ82_002513 [Podila clonocystis]|nr:hypothetical protein BGZ82_002513 [Podila clonocystis]